MIVLCPPPQNGEGTSTADNSPSLVKEGEGVRLPLFEVVRLELRQWIRRLANQVVDKANDLQAGHGECGAVGCGFKSIATLAGAVVSAQAERTKANAPSAPDALAVFAVEGGELLRHNLDVPREENGCRVSDEQAARVVQVAV